MWHALTSPHSMVQAHAYPSVEYELSLCNHIMNVKGERTLSLYDCGMVIRGRERAPQNPRQPKVRPEQSHIVPMLGYDGQPTRLQVGRYVLWVVAAYTRQMCSACGFTDKKNRNGRVFLCLSCRHLAHADRNAARNIGDAWMHIWADPAGSLCTPSIRYLISRPRPPEAPMLGDIWTLKVFALALR